VPSHESYSISPSSYRKRRRGRKDRDTGRHEIDVTAGIGESGALVALVGGADGAHLRDRRGVLRRIALVVLVAHRGDDDDARGHHVVKDIDLGGILVPAETQVQDRALPIT
jgi:hypothetical protein